MIGSAENIKKFFYIFPAGERAFSSEDYQQKCQMIVQLLRKQT